MKKMIFITITAINILALNTFAVDETSHQISRPVFPKTTIPFDHKSSEQGICQILGYETGVPGSIRAWPDDYNERGEGLLINEYGDIVRMTNNSPVVLGIVCINKTRKNKLNLKLSSLNYPKHPKSKLFFLSLALSPASVVPLDTRPALCLEVDAPIETSTALRTAWSSMRADISKNLSTTTTTPALPASLTRTKKKLLSKSLTGGSTLNQTDVFLHRHENGI